MILTTATNMTELIFAAKAYSEEHPELIVYAFTIFHEGYIEQPSGSATTLWATLRSAGTSEAVSSRASQSG